MTNEEAIKKLKAVQAEFNENWIDYGGINQAFNLAFEALKSQALVYKVAETREVKRQEDLNKIKFDEVKSNEQRFNQP